MTSGAGRVPPFNHLLVTYPKAAFDPLSSLAIKPIALLLLPVSRSILPLADGNSDGKHPLECRWTLWFDPGSGKNNMATWGQTLMPVYSFQTVEDFWW